MAYKKGKTSRGAKSRTRKTGKAVVSKEIARRSSRTKCALYVLALIVLVGAIVVTARSTSNIAGISDGLGQQEEVREYIVPEFELVHHAYQSGGPRTLNELLELPDEELEELDLAVMNLVCAEGLPGAEALDIDGTLATLDEWARHAKLETDRHLYKFHANPGEWDNSEARWRMGMLVTSLQLDCGVRYNPERIRDVDFSKSKDLYIHGMVEPGMKPIRWADNEEEAEALLDATNGGTCASMPVLYTAIAQRLGYPVYISSTKGHLFCRWDGEGHENSAYRDYFNIEGTNRGINIFDDDYYMTWPFTVTSNEVEVHGFFRSEESKVALASFMATRGHCLLELGNLYDALIAYQHAARLDPERRYYQQYVFHVNDLLLPPESRISHGGHGQMPRTGESRRRQEDPAAWVNRINAENRRRMERGMIQPENPHPPNAFDDPFQNQQPVPGGYPVQPGFETNY